MLFYQIENQHWPSIPYPQILISPQVLTILSQYISYIFPLYTRLLSMPRFRNSSSLAWIVRALGQGLCAFIFVTKKAAFIKQDQDAVKKKEEASATGNKNIIMKIKTKTNQAKNRRKKKKWRQSPNITLNKSITGRPEGKKEKLDGGTSVLLHDERGISNNPPEWNNWNAG